MDPVPWDNLLRSLEEKQRLHHPGDLLHMRIRSWPASTCNIHILVASNSRPPILDHSPLSLTSHFHNVSRDNVPSLDSLH